jgi:hypothetical protein
VGRAEEVCIGAVREITTRWATLFVATLYSFDGPLSQDGSPRFLVIKSNSELVFPQGFFQGFLLEYLVQCDWFLFLMFSLIIVE